MQNEGIDKSVMSGGEDAVTDIWKEYQKGLEYQGKIGIRENIPKYVDFYEGHQWPSPTENTKNLPRPVINIVKMICRNKKSALLSVPVRLVYKADNEGADAKLFTNFAEYIQKEMRQKQHDKLAVSDGVIKGSYFYHYYWDAEAVGLGGQIEGGMRCENIDPLDIFFANPRELDEQKQKWIIISSRESVDAVRSKADPDVNKDDIVADDAESNPYKVQEQDEAGLCTVLTKYFRRGGQVYCEQATKKVVFKKAWHILPAKPEAGGQNAKLTPSVSSLRAEPEGSFSGTRQTEILRYAQNDIVGGMQNAKLDNPSTAMGGTPQHKAYRRGTLEQGRLGVHEQVGFQGAEAKAFGSRTEGQPFHHGVVPLSTRHTAGAPLHRGGNDGGSRVDAPNNSLPDDTVAVEDTPKVRELYPIVAGYYEKREKCIYGLSEVEGLIPNQKAINFHLAMSLLNAQEMAWGKWLALPNALKGQKISNVPGQVLIDHSGTGNGIRKMSEQTIHSLPLDIVNVVMELTRSTTGATEVMSGELPQSGMSGAAIAQLQAQAQQPIEELRESFWLVKEKQGLVLAQFFKHFYYFDKSFTYEELSEETQEEEEKNAVFNSANFEGINFSVVVEATQGTRSSVVSDVAMLDSMLSSGAIDVKAYLTAYPDSAIGNKSELIRIIEQKEQSEINTLQAQVEELSAQLEQSAGVIKRQDQVVQNILPTIQENNQLKAQLAELQAEYAEKITVQNDEIGRLSAMYEQADRDAGDFAEEIMKTAHGGANTEGGFQ